MDQLKKITIWFLLPMLACILLFVLEQIWMADYITKSIAKAILFLGIPFSTGFFMNRNFEAETFGGEPQRQNPFKQFLPGLVIGTAVIGVIVIAYLMIRNKIDSVAIMAELNQKSGITPQTYLLTGLYISLGNSFLEEFFFRRFIFLNLYQSGMRYFAHIGSALLFSVYHLAIFQTWFSPLVMALALIGLFAAGLFLNYLVQRTNSLFSSWIVHMCANLVIIGIGFTWM